MAENEFAGYFRWRARALLPTEAQHIPNALLVKPWRNSEAKSLSEPGLARWQAPKERDTHSAVMLGGQMVVFGGDRGGEYLADVWSYSLADNAWTRLQVCAGMLAAVHGLISNVATLQSRLLPGHDTTDVLMWRLHLDMAVKPREGPSPLGWPHVLLPRLPSLMQRPVLRRFACRVVAL